MIASNESPEAWSRCLAVIRPALALAPRTYLQDIQDRLAVDGIQAAVARRDTPVVYDWAVRLLARQGISNTAADVYAGRNGSPTWEDTGLQMARSAFCPRLRSYWNFADCGYRRSVATCNTPHHLVDCPVADVPARKGTLAEAAIGFWLFIRDACDGEFVGWVDERLAAADPGVGDPQRGVTMRTALLEPLTNIVGTGAKTWNMILAELLLGGDPERERWTTTGASFIAIDSLVHAFLQRTGILRRLDAEHGYGPACYTPGGCAEVIAALAERIDARVFGPAFPAVFPRWVQFAIWSFCAADRWNICNAVKIDDRVGCRQRFCPAFETCDRLPLPASTRAHSRVIRIDIKQNT